MIRKMVKFTLVFFLLFAASPFSPIVNADHKEKKEYKKEHKEKYRYEKHDDDDDDDDDDEKYEFENRKDDEIYQESNPFSANSFWNAWTREASNYTNNDLPFQDAKEVNLELDQQSAKFFIVPQNGQLLISSEKIANFLGVEVDFFPQSEILVISNKKNELIIRAGTNAVYENMVKTPMPAQAVNYENSIYLPISVIANAFNYRVSWDTEKETILLQTIN
ncbi:copper amine oxidase N-terminal domain-containing protein [Bacillus sp. Bva_UNVM-123]|uniref:copper amine oxidase N-terminal domain-containing protein n=1 Tax=Bacillus sp. Bva_UNVM-123 TaxID=2829798 RepID=UPI00391FC5DB